MNLKYIEELQGVIRRSHGAESKYVESVPIKETFEGKTVWQGVVEVFDLVDQHKAPRVYAWAQDTSNPRQPRRYVTVLHIAPVLSAEAAVRALIAQELTSSEPEDES